MPAFVSPDNIQITPLQSVAFAPGASVSIPTAGALPTGRRVRSVIFRLDADFTQPGAGMAAQLGGVLFQLLAQVKIGRRVSITGLGMHFLNWAQRGHQPNFCPGWAAGAAADVLSRSVTWCLDYVDLTSRTPDDAAVPSELWTDPIEVRFNTNAIFAATVPAIGSGVLRVFVVHDAASSAKNGRRVTVPQSLNIQSDDFAALTAQINKPGAYAYAILYREAANDDGIITSANVSNAIVSVDGVPVTNSMRAQDIASVFNQVRAAAPGFRSEGQVNGAVGANNATAAPCRGGANINDQPGSAVAAGQGVTVDFLPLIFPGFNYHVSQLARAKVGMRIDLTGTIGAYKVAYRLIERRPDQAIANAARRLGITSGAYGAKTDVKNTLGDDPELAPFLPATVRE